MTAVDVRVAEIAARAEAAPPGPWTSVLNSERTWNLIVVDGGTDDEYLLAKVADDDATDFMIAARDDIPFLLSEVRRLRSVVEDAEKVIAEADKALGDMPIMEGSSGATSEDAWFKARVMDFARRREILSTYRAGADQ